MRKFNINGYVKVKLTETGIAEMKRQHMELKKSFHNIHDFIPPTTDEDGYVKFQLHDLISRLGHLCYLSNNNLPFETDILIDN